MISLRKETLNIIGYGAIFLVLFAWLFIFPPADHTYDTHDNNHENQIGKDSGKIMFEDTLLSVVMNATELSQSNRNWQAIIQQYKDSVKSSLDGKTYRKDLIIRYYEKQKDQGLIDSLKHDFGFYIHKPPTKRHLFQEQTNIIYYGDSVENRDVIAVALRLIELGIPIKKIGESKFHADYKKRSIELATDTLLSDLPILTPEIILKFKK